MSTGPSDKFPWSYPDIYSWNMLSGLVIFMPGFLPTIPDRDIFPFAKPFVVYNLGNVIRCGDMYESSFGGIELQTYSRLTLYVGNPKVRLSA